ncbi:MAG: FAD-dependent oxidoreductase [Planctomycetes bacterium]|nr:FAD-dependent oxidoreductase [Planctomycetota bacterium]
MESNQASLDHLTFENLLFSRHLVETKSLFKQITVFIFVVCGLLLARSLPSCAADHTAIEYDIIVYGDSSGAVTAAVAAKRLGCSVILINPTHFPGGMSASGLGATDFLGKRSTFGGIASEFYDEIAGHYGKTFVRSFEPHVGRNVFHKLIAETEVPTVFNEKINRQNGVKLQGKRIVSITTLSGRTYRGRMFIDATYVGDLMAAAGITYTIGREPESKYGEDLAGVRRGDTQPRIHYTQKDKDHFIADVDPYIKPGDPTSGLLSHIFKIDDLTNGQGDKKIQAYNYRVCLTTDPKRRIPIEKPADYRDIDHELLLRNFEAGDHRVPALIEPLSGTGNKVDWNSMHAIGSDYASVNWEYPEASYQRRCEIEEAHETYIRGHLWTLSNNPRVPANIRRKVSPYGLPKDEFTDNGGWPYMIYIREARRMVSDYVMTQQDCEGTRTVSDPVGLGSFGMDSHVVQYYVNEQGYVRRDGTIWRVPPKPYGISYRSIVPRQGECENLLVPVCLSASHVAHGSIRMEPVFMVLGQSAATAASLATANSAAVQDVQYAQLRERLLKDRQILNWPK